MRKNWLVAGILLPFFAVFFAFQIAPLIWILVNSCTGQVKQDTFSQPSARNAPETAPR